MKKITLFSILAAFVAALSLTSCNTDSDNDYSALSQESQKNYQAAMSMELTTTWSLSLIKRTMPMSTTRQTLCIHLYT